MAEVMIAEAVHDERGRYSAGKAGDQSGDEVRIRKWYNRPWNYVLRWMDPNMAKKFAYAMKAAANNSKIGYDQGQRNTLLTSVRKYAYDTAKAETCECDCSSLVSVAAMYAGIPERLLFKSGNCSTTANLRSRLIGTGALKSYNSKSFVSSFSNLIVGDILLYEGHHVAAVIESNTEATGVTVTEIAQQVIRGLWGSGEERKKRLKAAGHDPDKVQAEVNRLLGSKK